MVDQNPSKYGRQFKSLRIGMGGGYQTIDEIRRKARKNGHHMADAVEIALEFAQQIANGESWSTICNEPDDSKVFRVIEWKHCKIAVVGGAGDCSENYPASHIIVGTAFELRKLLAHAVPAIITYII